MTNICVVCGRENEPRHVCQKPFAVDTSWPSRAVPVNVAETKLRVTYADIGGEIGEFTDKKAAEYGGAAEKVAKIIAILYPDGIPVHAYPDALLIVRDLDKTCRLANRASDGKDKGGESPWRDKAGYALLGTAKDEK